MRTLDGIPMTRPEQERLKQEMAKLQERLKQESAKLERQFEAMDLPDRVTGAKKIKEALSKANAWNPSVDDALLQSWISGELSSDQLVAHFGDRVAKHT